MEARSSHPLFLGLRAKGMAPLQERWEMGKKGSHCSGQSTKQLMMQADGMGEPTGQPGMEAWPMVGPWLGAPVTPC